MKICILDGSQENERRAESLHKSLEPLLAEHQIQHLVIREMKIASCVDDFLCWTKPPGICKNKDDNRLVAKAMVQSDLLVLLSPITFGGYSSLLKKGLDHQIQVISPFFAKVQGETHHRKLSIWLQKSPTLLPCFVLERSSIGKMQLQCME